MNKKPAEGDPRIVGIKFWLDGKLAATWGKGDFSSGENDVVLRLTPKIIDTRDE